jgi:hypothetical protein
MAEPDLVDEILDFKGMKTGSGTAFALSSDKMDETGAPLIPVAKRWQQTGGRTFLIESVLFSAIQPYLNTLPPAPAVKEASLTPRSAEGFALPAVRARLTPLTPMRLARPEVRMAMNGKNKALSKEPVNRGQRVKIPACQGFVLDYQLLSSATNMTLRGDTTYYVSGPVNLSGTTILEGGAVIKYTNQNSPRILLTGPLDCRTTAYRPAIFTAKDDDTVGEIIPGSGGNPSGYYGNPALNLDANQAGVSFNLGHVRVAHAQTGVTFYMGTGNVLSHAQLVHCGDALYLYDGTTVSVRNALIHNVVNAIEGAVSSTVRGEHLTLNQATALNYYNDCAVYLTNSVIVAMPNSGYTGAYNQYSSVTNGIFQWTGAGGHYLATNGWRNQGTANITPGLLTDLKQLTTYPPLILTNDIVLDTVLSPTAPRDTDTPDLGYHYDPIDYAFSGTVLSNATLVLTNGVAVGVFGTTGLELKSAAKLFSAGTALNLNRWVRYPAVQEQSVL